MEMVQAKELIYEMNGMKRANAIGMSRAIDGVESGRFAGAVCGDPRT